MRIIVDAREIVNYVLSLAKANHMHDMIHVIKIVYAEGATPYVQNHDEAGAY